MCYSCGIIYLIVNKHVFEHRLLWITEQLCCCKYIFSFISIHSTMVKLILCFVPLQISVLCLSYRWCKETSISVDPNMCDPAWILIYRLRVCAQLYLYACLNNAPCIYAWVLNFVALLPWKLTDFHREASCNCFGGEDGDSFWFLLSR